MLTGMSLPEDYDIPIRPGDAPADDERKVRTDELLARDVRRDPAVRSKAGIR